MERIWGRRLAAGLIAIALIPVFAASAVRGQEPAAGKDKGAETPAPKEDKEARYAAQRKRMVERHLVERGLKNPRVLDAFRTVPRHLFLPPGTQRLAYDDESIPIGEGQTITPPYDVA